MSTQKEVLEQIAVDVKHIKNKQNDMKSQQDDMDLRLNEIDIVLRGTSYDRDRGGLVNQVNSNTDCLNSVKKKQYKITTVGVVVITGINVLFAAIRTFFTN